MKYNIRINQLALMSSKLDLKDAAILDYLIGFCAVDSKKKKQLSFSENGKDCRYTWINFSHLIEEMPLLRIKGKASVSERIDNIAKEGYVKTFRAPDRSLYVRLTEKCEDLDFRRDIRINEQVIRNGEQKVFEKPNSTSILSPNTNSNEGAKAPTNSSGFEKKQGDPRIKTVIEYFSQMCQQIKSFKPVINWGAEGAMIKRYLNDYSENELNQAFLWFLESAESEKLGCTIKVALSNYVFNKWLAQRNL